MGLRQRAIECFWQSVTTPGSIDGSPTRTYWHCHLATHIALTWTCSNTEQWTSSPLSRIWRTQSSSGIHRSSMMVLSQTNKKTLTAACLPGAHFLDNQEDVPYFLLHKASVGYNETECKRKYGTRLFWWRHLCRRQLPLSNCGCCSPFCPFSSLGISISYVQKKKHRKHLMTK